jgi:hypothetical protein
MQGDPCFIHEMFYVNHISQKQCDCGKKSEVIESDRNLFAETVNILRVLKEIDMTMLDESQRVSTAVLNSVDSKVRQFKAVRNKFFEIVNQIMTTSSTLCVQDGTVSKEITNNPKKHRTRYVHKLQKTLPEVLTFNLVWD